MKLVFTLFEASEANVKFFRDSVLENPYENLASIVTGKSKNNMQDFATDLVKFFFPLHLSAAIFKKNIRNFSSNIVNVFIMSKVQVASSDGKM